MTGKLLDVSTLPREQVFTCYDGSQINLREFLHLHYDAVQALAASGLIKANDSFGFAMAEPMWHTTSEARQSENPDFWDMPDDFVWFVGGWGDNSDRYIANAVRKMRALLRTHTIPVGTPVLQPFDSTLELRLSMPAFFRDKVDSQNPDGTFPWGDFPWGGAAFVRMGGLTLAGAVSCLTEVEDDIVARLILGGIAQRIVEGEKLLAY